MLKDIDLKCYECPIKVKIVYEMKGKRRIDLDNCSKSLLDILQGKIMKDDCQIFDLHLTKVLGCADDCIHVEWEDITDE